VSISKSLPVYEVAKTKANIHSYWLENGGFANRFGPLSKRHWPEMQKLPFGQDHRTHTWLAEREGRRKNPHYEMSWSA